MEHPIGIHLTGGILLLTRPGLIRARLTHGDSGLAAGHALTRLRGDPRALAELRRGFHRLGLPDVPARAGDLQLLAAVDRAARLRRIDIHWLAGDLSFAPVDRIDIVRARPAEIRLWTPHEKIAEALMRARDRLTREFDQVTRQFFERWAFAWALPQIAALAEPDGFAPLYAFAWQAGGAAALLEMPRFAEATRIAAVADSMRAIDDAAARYAEAMQRLGVRWQRQFVARLRKRGIQANREAETRSRVKPAGSRMAPAPIYMARNPPPPDPVAAALPLVEPLLDLIDPAPPAAAIPGNLDVIVLLEPDDTPMRGVRIAVSGGIADSRTSRPGREYWEDIPPGQYSATASYEGVDDVSGVATVPPGGTGQIVLRMRPVVTVKLISLTFNSDHQEAGGVKLLKRAMPEVLQREILVWNEATEQDDKSYDSITSGYTNNHGEFKKPEWSIERGGAQDSHPISQTKNTPLDVTLLAEFTVRPDFATVPLTNVFGRTSDNSTQFEENYDIRVVDKERVKFANLVAKLPLLNWVKHYDHVYDWWFTLNGEIQDVGATGTHRIYVTYDRPIGAMRLNGRGDLEEAGTPQVITDWRLMLAVEDAWETGVVSERECVDAIFAAQRKRGVGYVLGRRYDRTGNRTGLVPKPSVPHYLWLCAAHSAQGECHNIAAGFQLECRAIGCSGSFELGYLMPQPSRFDVAPDYPKLDAEPAGTMPVQGRFSSVEPYSCYVRQHIEAEHADSWESIMFIDSSGRSNNFEGVTCYDGHVMYAIGDAIFDAYGTKDENASAYFAVRRTSADLHSSVTDWSRGWAQLHFVTHGTLHPCAKPYSWSSGPTFNWAD